MTDISRKMTRPWARSLPRPARRLVRKAVVLGRHRHLTRDDVLLVSYPKSGSTWLRFVVCQTLVDREVDFDSIPRVSPPLGAHRYGPSIAAGGRLIKSHEPKSRLTRPPSKVLYLARDGRDVAVSMYFFLQRRGAFQGAFPEFLDAFLEGKTDNYGSWQRHVLSWLGTGDGSAERRSLLTYEDMLREGAPAISSAFSQIGVELDVARLDRAMINNSMQAMRIKEERSTSLSKSQGDTRDSRSVPFVRSGRSGGWEKHFTSALHDQFMTSAGTAMQRLGYS